MKIEKKKINSVSVFQLGYSEKYFIAFTFLLILLWILPQPPDTFYEFALLTAALVIHKVRREDLLELFDC